MFSNHNAQKRDSTITAFNLRLHEIDALLSEQEQIIIDADERNPETELAAARIHGLTASTSVFVSGSQKSETCTRDMQERRTPDEPLPMFGDETGTSRL
jgi:hypothetical protein